MTIFDFQCAIATMTADAATVAPTKLGRKAWMIALAVVVAVVTIVLLSTPPKPEPVKVWFVRATNEAGEKKLVFEGTNGLRRELSVNAYVFYGAIDETKAPQASLMVDGIINITAPGGTNFVFALKEPTNDSPYYLKWWFYDETAMSTRLGRLQYWCYDFLSAHNMRRLAKPFQYQAKPHYILSTEIKE